MWLTWVSSPPLRDVAVLPRLHGDQREPPPNSFSTPSSDSWVRSALSLVRVSCCVELSEHHGPGGKDSHYPVWLLGRALRGRTRLRWPGEGRRWLGTFRVENQTQGGPTRSPRWTMHVPSGVISKWHKTAKEASPGLGHLSFPCGSATRSGSLGVRRSPCRDVAEGWA